jgi:hypothetical protein
LRGEDRAVAVTNQTDGRAGRDVRDRAAAGYVDVVCPQLVEHEAPRWVIAEYRHERCAQAEPCRGAGEDGGRPADGQTTGLDELLNLAVLDVVRHALDDDVGVRVTDHEQIDRVCRSVHGRVPTPRHGLCGSSAAGK